MTKTLWAPNVERLLGPHRAGGSLVGGPPRVVHHITWDALSPKGERPRFQSVAKYLTNAGFEPHLMIDPILGTAVQFVPFNRASYALRNASGGGQTNRMGDACIQVEWFFSPNCVVNGKKYATLEDTPMLGLGLVMAIAKEYGIPAEWPMGKPNWKSQRSLEIWTTKAGHYGHSQVIENTHNDPGPMSLPDPAPPIQTGEPLVATKAELDYIVNAVVAKLGGPRPADHSDPDKRFISLGDVLTGVEKEGEASRATLVEALGSLGMEVGNLAASVQQVLMTLSESKADPEPHLPTPTPGTPEGDNSA